MLEVLLPVGLDAERGPDAVDGGLRDPLASAMERQLQCVLPSGGLVSSVLLSSPVISSSSMERGLPGLRWSYRPHEELGSKTLAPLVDRLGVGDRLVVQAIGAQQSEIAPLRPEVPGAAGFGVPRRAELDGQALRVAAGDRA